MSYIIEAQERVYKKFIREFGGKLVTQADEQVFREITVTRMKMRKGLFGSSDKVWYYKMEV